MKFICVGDFSESRINVVIDIYFIYASMRFVAGFDPRADRVSRHTATCRRASSLSARGQGARTLHWGNHRHENPGGRRYVRNRKMF